jgi:hypothetical protein
MRKPQLILNASFVGILLTALRRGRLRPEEVFET